MSGGKKAKRARRRLAAWTTFVVLLALLLVGGWLVTGAGGSKDDPPAGNDAYVELVDITLSTDDDRDTYLVDMQAVADHAALGRDVIYADAFDGNPRAHVRWRVHRSFRRLPAFYHGNPDLIDSYLQGQGRALAPRLQALVASRAVRAGTPLGATLLLAADLCAQQRTVGLGCRVFIFTDGEFIGEGIDSRRPIPASAQRAWLDAWAPRLGGLAGARVSFVGVGYGTGDDSGLDDARSIAATVIAKAGGTMPSGDAGWAVRVSPGALG